jgi:hypothetical protein
VFQKVQVLLHLHPGALASTTESLAKDTRIPDIDSSLFRRQLLCWEIMGNSRKQLRPMQL